VREVYEIHEQNGEQKDREVRDDKALANVFRMLNLVGSARNVADTNGRAAPQFKSEQARH
jgi:hypothetical protein